ncbi:hypothetical protein DL93DRAFT_1353254 [Clavulina sp. PMI_390]|nr:hypothetical protein DL93DRAFT_1353254 [Clavulina sp. PMI_390]
MRKSFPIWVIICAGTDGTRPNKSTKAQCPQQLGRIQKASVDGGATLVVSANAAFWPCAENLDVRCSESLFLPNSFRHKRLLLNTFVTATQRTQNGAAFSGTTSSAMNRAASFDTPAQNPTVAARRGAEKPAASNRDRSGSNASTSSQILSANPTYRQLNFDRGSHSKPPTTGPSSNTPQQQHNSRERSSSLSLFARSREKIFRKSSNASRVSADTAEAPKPLDPPTPTIDIHRQDDFLNLSFTENEKDTDADRELVILRDNAARSIGMTPPLSSAVPLVMSFAHD